MDGHDQPYAPSNPQPPPQQPQAEKEQPPVPESPQKEHLPPGYQRRRGNRGWLYAVLAVIVLTALLAAGWWWQQGKNKNNDTVQPAASSGGQNPTQVASQISSAVKTYESSKQKLSFDYPADWTSSETTGAIKVISPPIKLTDADGQSVTGQITLLVRTKSQPLPEFDNGNATATLASQKMSYAKPTKVQREQTYVSFLRFSKESVNGIDGIYVTGNFGYKAGQAVQKQDIASADPKISVTFQKCTDNSCLQNPLSLSIAKTSWEKADFATPILNIFKSFSIN